MAWRNRSIRLSFTSSSASCRRPGEGRVCSSLRKLKTSVGAGDEAIFSILNSSAVLWILLVSREEEFIQFPEKAQLCWKRRVVLPSPTEHTRLRSRGVPQSSRVTGQMSRKVEVAALTSLRSTGLLGSPAAATTALASDTSALSREREMEDGGWRMRLTNSQLLSSWQS